MENKLNTKVRPESGHRMALILILILALCAIYLKMQENNLRQVLQSSYDKSFYELVEYVDNIETLLAKSQISYTPEYSAKTLTEVWRVANLAESCLSQIPITHVTLEKAVKFLNQTGDYSYSLSRKTIENQNLSQEDLDNLQMLYTSCKTLNETLAQVSNDLGSGGLKWNELTKQNSNTIFAQEVSNITQNSFENIEKDLQDYEGLIYDGPFSEHMTSMEPKGLGEEKYTQEMATEKVYEYIDRNTITDVKYNGLVDGTIKAHSFDVILKDHSIVYINITELGGHVLWMTYNRSVKEEKIDRETAAAKATSFLEGHGFTNMKESYYTNENGVLTINYAYTQNGVVCYTDLIKVKVALDNGDIVGMESKGYLNSHMRRNFEEPAVSIEEAKSKINPKLQINSEGLALIPTDWSTEVLAYEFKGKVEENDFIVYVNAKTGKEEKIFMILDTPNGILAI